MAHKWLQSAVKHKGLLGKEAADSGRSKLQQAQVDSHSPDTSKRGRGILGVRLIKKQI